MATRKPLAKSEPKKETAAVKKEVAKEKVERAEQIPARDFVPVWQSKNSTEEVAKHFERDAVWASGFACRLRKIGVHLKKMPKVGGGGGRKLDVDELNALIE